MILDEDKYQVVMYKQNKDNTYTLFRHDLPWRYGEATYESLNQALATFEEWGTTCRGKPRKVFKVGILFDDEELYLAEVCRELLDFINKDMWTIKEEDIVWSSGKWRQKS